MHRANHTLQRLTKPGDCENDCSINVSRLQGKHARAGVSQEVVAASGLGVQRGPLQGSAKTILEHCEGSEEFPDLRHV